MSNIIELLHELITPEILAFAQDEDGTNDNKKGALGVLYGLLAVRLSDEMTANRLASLDDDAVIDGERILGELFKGDDTAVNSTGLLSTLTQVISTQFKLAPESANTLALAGLPLAYNQIKQLAGDNVSAFLTPQKDALVATLPTWLTALLPIGVLSGLGLGLSSAAAAPTNPLVELPVPETPVVPEPTQITPESITPTHESNNTNETSDTTTHVATTVAPTLPITEPTNTESTPHQTAPTTPAAPIIPPAAQPTNQPKKGGFLKSFLPFVAALIIAIIVWLMLKSCQQQPTQVAVPPPPTLEQIQANIAIPATLKLALNETGDGLYAFDGNVGSDGLGEQIKQAVFSIFGKFDKVKIGVNHDVAKEMPVLQYLPQLLGFMKGVPDASITIDGKSIWVNSSNPEALAKLIQDLQTALPKDFNIAAEPKLNAEEAVAKSLEEAKIAIDGLNANSSPEALVRALNLQIINFASGSSEIPTQNKEILDKAVALIGEMSNIHLAIVGHTDNQGSMESNQKLSESRANAVREYLVSKGANPASLITHGASFNEPIASNATEQGRFANRRIEFVLADTSTVQTIDQKSMPDTTIEETGDAVEEVILEEVVEESNQ